MAKNKSKINRTTQTQPVAKIEVTKEEVVTTVKPIEDLGIAVYPTTSEEPIEISTTTTTPPETWHVNHPQAGTDVLLTTEEPAHYPQPQKAEPIIDTFEPVEQPYFTPEPFDSNGNVPESQILVYLATIRSVMCVTVSDFRDLTYTGQFARAVLNKLIEYGYVSRTWQQDAGRYSLTNKGLALLSSVN